MSAGSVIHDVVIGNKEDARRFVVALEEAEKKVYAEGGMVSENPDEYYIKEPGETPLSNKDVKKLYDLISNLPIRELQDYNFTTDYIRKSERQRVMRQVAQTIMRELDASYLTDQEKITFVRDYCTTMIDVSQTNDVI